jgi:hypothetical protein
MTFAQCLVNALTGEMKSLVVRHGESGGSNLFSRLRSFFALEKLQTIDRGAEKSCVPDTFQLRAILPYSAFLASRKINNLCVFNNHEYFDFPRLHHLYALALGTDEQQYCPRLPIIRVIRSSLDVGTLQNAGRRAANRRTDVL